MAVPPAALIPFVEQLTTLGIDHYICAAVNPAGVDVLVDQVVARFNRVEVG
jgi:hypothetical protein